mgnify:CR=1 FL=1
MNLYDYPYDRDIIGGTRSFTCMGLYWAKRLSPIIRRNLPTMQRPARPSSGMVWCMAKPMPSHQGFRPIAFTRAAHRRSLCLAEPACSKPCLSPCPLSPIRLSSRSPPLTSDLSLLPRSLVSVGPAEGPRGIPPTRPSWERVSREFRPRPCKS